MRTTTLVDLLNRPRSAENDAAIAAKLSALSSDLKSCEESVACIKDRLSTLSARIDAGRTASR